MELNMLKVATTAKPYTFDVVEARSMNHPVFPGVSKHIFLLQASKLPTGLPTGANARDPVGMNRRVYADVKASLKGEQAWPGSFDLMNLGITIIAKRVEMIEKGKFKVSIEDEEGIVNGAHTCRIIESCQGEGSIPEEQHIEVRVITGIDSADIAEDLKVDIAKGQNTGITVKAQSIYEISGVFDGIKDQIAEAGWFSKVAWKESDMGEVDVRDLIAALEVINVKDYPNDGDAHPIHAYEKWSKALEKYADDFKANPNRRDERLYAAFEPLLLEALELYDRIRHDFRDLFNENVSPAAGRMRIVEEAPPSRGNYEFPFSRQAPARYRLTKGATYPIFAAFRNCVAYETKTKKAYWIGGFKSVLQLWKEAGPELVKETYNATKDVGHLPDQLGKSRGHWAGLHRALEVRLLRQQIKKATR
jgi:AIPR protein